ncbi:hypothetical protein OAZ24_04980 [Synechococcus sp. AH-736-G21]|nr:hypothetical protein [Synechococcus sp. AH-736-G21]
MIHLLLETVDVFRRISHQMSVAPSRSPEQAPSRIPRMGDQACMRVVRTLRSLTFTPGKTEPMDNDNSQMA